MPSTRIPHQTGDVMVESWLRDAPIRLNPDIVAGPDWTDKVIYNLRAILLSVQVDGPVQANENFVTWHPGADLFLHEYHYLPANHHAITKKRYQ